MIHFIHSATADDIMGVGGVMMCDVRERGALRAGQAKAKKRHSRDLSSIVVASPPYVQQQPTTDEIMEGPFQVGYQKDRIEWRHTYTYERGYNTSSIAVAHSSSKC
eukprot:scaffold38770_cov63-Cyclotella_meneghiniana.AAC.3